MGSAQHVVLEALAVMAIFGSAWALIARRFGADSAPFGGDLGRSLRRTMESWAATWGIAGLLVVSTMAPATLSAWLVLLLGACCLGFARLVLSLSPLGAAADRPRAVVLGACQSARALTSTPVANEAVEFVGLMPFAHEDHVDIPHLHKLGSIANLSEMLRNHDFDAAVVTLSDRAVTHEVHDVMKARAEAGLQAQYFPAILGTDGERGDLSWTKNRP